MTTVQEQPRGRIVRACVGLDRPAIAKVEVKPAVAIGIEQGQAAGHDLWKVVFATRSRMELELNA